MDSTEDSGIGKVKNNSSLISPHYIPMMVGRMMPLLALFATTILYAHQLPSASYGIFQSIWMYVNIVSVILGFGVTTIIFSSQVNTFLSLVKYKLKIITIFYTGLWIVALIIFAIAAHQYSLSLKLWVIIFIILQATNTITESWLIRNGGEVRYFLVNTSYGIAFFAWHFIVLRSGFDIEWLIKGIVCFAIVKFLLLIQFSKRASVEVQVPEQNPLIFSHWAFNGINDIINILTKWIDKLILVYLLTPTEFAIFFNGSIEIPLLSIFISFSGSLMMVQMAKGKEKNESVVPVFRENFLLLSAIIFPIFFFLLFFRYPVFHFIFGAQYVESVPVFLITILILPLRTNTYGGILQVLGQGKIITSGSVIDLVLCILLVLVLYPLFGMRGAAIAIVISTAVQAIYYLLHTRQVLQTTFTALVPIPALIIRFLSLGILFGILHYFVQSLAPFTNIISGCILILACFLATGAKYLKLIPDTKKRL